MCQYSDSSVHPLRLGVEVVLADQISFSPTAWVLPTKNSANYIRRNSIYLNKYYVLGNGDNFIVRLKSM